MVSRRTVFIASLLATAVSSFTLGVIQSHRAGLASDASYEAKLEAIRTEVREQLGKPVAGDGVKTAGTSGKTGRAKDDADNAAPATRARMVAEIKQELQNEMGLLPVTLLRDRRASFVELWDPEKADPPRTQREIGEEIARANHVSSLTNCSVCHR